MQTYMVNDTRRTLHITLSTARKIRGEVGVDLLRFGEPDDEHGVVGVRILRDPETTLRVIAAATTDPVTPEELEGEFETTGQFGLAAEALRRELSDFFRRWGRAELADACDMIERRLDEARQQIRGEQSGTSSGSPASTPAT